MSSVNKVILIGNVGKDPEIRSTNSGNEIANFSLATSKKWKDKDGNQKSETEWHKIVVFNKGLVQIIKQYIKKGSRLYIEGYLKTTEYTDKLNVKRYTTEICINNFEGSLTMLTKSDNKGNGNITASHGLNYEQASNGF